MFIKELKSKIPIDPKRKVCNNCHFVGHNIKSISCPINIQKKENDKNKIKEYVLGIDPLEDINFEDLSKKIDRTLNYTKNLYSSIEPKTWLTRDISDQNIFKMIQSSLEECQECHQKINKNALREWKNTKICDLCWLDPVKSNYREYLWDQIYSYKIQKCSICLKEKKDKNQRYHWDHLNMFDKNDSISSMVSKGDLIETIQKEIDKCQLLCYSCHQFVCEIEIKLGFTRIKTGLTKKLNNNEITLQQYQIETNKFQKIYKEKILELYKKCSDIILSKKN